MGSFDSGDQTADSIARTDCWWDNGDVNGLYGSIGITMVS